MQWSFRIQQEMKASKSAHFVTLTYDRENLKRVNYQLNKRDLQLFLKRVRKRLTGQRIRYYAVGEYGTKSGRAHYHIILFNCDENTIRKSWINPITQKPNGIVHVGYVTLASIQYCLKYIVQKDSKSLKDYQAPFATMSRLYGLGAHYLTNEMIDWHRSGNKTYTMQHGIKGVLPKFYHAKIWPRENELKQVKTKLKWTAIKEHRQKLREWKKLFPNDWKQKRAEHIQAVIEKVKIKIQQTQYL